MRRLLASIAIVVVVAAGSTLRAATTKFLDQFTTVSAAESCDVQVNHMTNTGASPFWSELLDTGADNTYACSTAGVARVGSTDTSDRLVWVATPDPALSSADYDVSAVFVNPQANQADDDHQCVVGRATDSTHFYLLCVDADTPPQTISISVANGTNGGAGGFLTPLVSTTYAIANNDIVRLSMRGNTLKGFGGAAGTTQYLCVVDNTLSAAGQGGIGQGDFMTSGADTQATVDFDNFTISDATGDGGDDDCGAVAGPPVGSRLRGRIGRAVRPGVLWPVPLGGWTRGGGQ